MNYFCCNLTLPYYLLITRATCIHATRSRTCPLVGARDISPRSCERTIGSRFYPFFNLCRASRSGGCFLIHRSLHFAWLGPVQSLPIPFLRAKNCSCDDRACLALLCSASGCWTLAFRAFSLSLVLRAWGTVVECCSVLIYAFVSFGFLLMTSGFPHLHRPACSGSLPFLMFDSRGLHAVRVWL